MFLFAAIADSPPGRKTAAVNEDLLAEIAGNDKEAFTALYRQAGRSVYAYALSLLKNPADAEDVMQDTFLKIRSAAALYVPQGKPMAWILTITRNLCLMKLRKNAHEASYAPDEPGLVSDLSGIEDLEDRLVMEAALRILSEEECQIVILHAVTGWKHREIARLMGLPDSTVLSKYHRGLKKLKHELEGKL